MLASLVQGVRRGVVCAVLLAGLTLVPSLSWAQRGQRDADSDRQTFARSRADVRPEPARPQPTQERGGNEARVAPAPAPSREPERSFASPQIWSRPQEQRTPVPDWRSREQPAPRSNPYQSYRQPSREVSTPATPSRYWGDQGQSNRERGATDRQDAYQLYRSPRTFAAPETPRGNTSEQPRWSRDRTQPQTRDGSQLYRAPRQVTVPEVNFGNRSEPTRGDQEQARERQSRPSGDTGRLTREPSGERARVRERAPQQETAPSQTRERERAQAGLPARTQRRFSVPEGSFRGPGAEEQVRVVPAQERQQWQERFRERVREQNRQLGRVDRVTRPTHDVVGNPVPRDATVLIRDNISRISIGYERIRITYGTPGFSYLVYPRTYDYWRGYWDGYSDGWWDGRHRHHPLVVINFWYPYYFSDPYFVGFWYGGYYPSIYTYFGWCPGWIYPSRVYYAPVEYVYVPVTPYRYYYTGYHLDAAGAAQAIRDIRRAWLDSDIGPLARHLTDQLDIRVYFDGEYSYTTSTDDFYQMTLDTLATTQTVSMDFNDPIWISGREVFYTGRQVFYDPDGNRQTLYVSFRLRQLGSEWYLVAVGTSLHPIRHEYKDFRYN